MIYVSNLHNCMKRLIWGGGRGGGGRQRRIPEQEELIFSSLHSLASLPTNMLPSWVFSRCTGTGGSFPRYGMMRKCLVSFGNTAAHLWHPARLLHLAMPCALHGDTGGC